VGGARFPFWDCFLQCNNTIRWPCSSWRVHVSGKHFLEMWATARLLRPRFPSYARKKHTVLGIETSCDDTGIVIYFSYREACSIVTSHRETLGEFISRQDHVHGVVRGSSLPVPLKSIRNYAVRCCRASSPKHRSNCYWCDGKSWYYVQRPNRYRCNERTGFRSVPRSGHFKSQSLGTNNLV
jgi:hypothetical protein